jgi:hypothetical protein
MTKCDWCKSPEHVALLEELCEHDPETQRQNKLIAEFYKVYPTIVGLSYEAADVLRMIKSPKLQRAAIKVVGEEISKRPRTGELGYTLTRRRVTEGRVRELVNEQHILIEGTEGQREKLAKKKELEDKEQLQECPRCHGLIMVRYTKRNTVVSLRVKEENDDFISFVADELGVSRSKLLSVFLQARARFSPSFS